MFVEKFFLLAQRSFLYTDAVDNLSADNVFETMVCADKYDVPQLHCGEVSGSVDLNSAAILQSTEFTDTSQDTLQNILKRDTLSAEENEIYLAVERWAEAACARNALDASGANRRQKLDSGLLSEGELLSVLLYQNATVKPQNLPFPQRAGRECA
ncbi:BTB/POZ domain-containing protein 2-like [Paramacrobiotus metropolitanus]|uniref:BTB/POZ domain-containing protein 2-like n=1 Tax=Paramacrobiotus metropolitanus TaxID=2943436 RepID=UPI0024462821|nr:BTB/POZ domain-containing protein 2-like [Paramacrobiotus metropolitanus]